jgi:hypothetical protein
VSSASTTATATIMVAHGQLQPEVAGIAVVLCSVSSAMANLPFVYRQTRQKKLTGSLAAFSSVMAFLGLAVESPVTNPQSRAAADLIGGNGRVAQQPGHASTRDCGPPPHYRSPPCRAVQVR